jgi:YidC/Oxa1 family membrane protein insertase
VNFFDIYLIDPFLNLVIFIYSTVGFENLGLTVILMTVLLRIILLPVSISSAKVEKKLRDLEPEIIKIENMTSNPQIRREKLSELFRQHKIDPYKDALSLAAQAVFAFFLYLSFNIIYDGGLRDRTYDFLEDFAPNSFNTGFLGIDLSEPSFNLAVLAALAMFAFLFLQSGKIVERDARTFSYKWYNILMPALVFIALNILTATKSIFLIVSALFSMAIRVFINSTQPQPTIEDEPREGK